MRCGLQCSDETADLYARQLLDGATSETTIAVVSVPSVFVAIKNILVSVHPLVEATAPCLVVACALTHSLRASSPAGTPKPALTLLEHDYRFGVFSEFQFYDFKRPVKLPGKPVMPWPGPTCTLAHIQDP